MYTGDILPPEDVKGFNLMSKVYIQYTEEDGWFITEEALTAHIKEHFTELREHATTSRDIGTKRLIFVILIALLLVLMVTGLAFSGNGFAAIIISFVALSEMKWAFSFLEGKDEK